MFNTQRTGSRAIAQAHEFPAAINSSASNLRHQAPEALWVPHSYMMMPQLLSGKPGSSRSITTSPLHVQLPNSNHDQMLHPIILIFQQQELGRHVLVLAIPMVIGLFSAYNPVNAPLAIRLTAVALSIGVAAIWNGILLRRTCLNASKWIELLGVAFMLLAFYGFIATALPNKTLIWIPLLCWLLNILPFAIALFSNERDRLPL